MKVFLSELTAYRDFIDVEKSKYSLQTIIRAKDDAMQRMISNSEVMIDSGAFTYRSKNNNVDWNDYIVQYANFINKWDIKLFIELDIDNLIGYDNVKKLRTDLEKLTDKPSIPA